MKLNYITTKNDIAKFIEFGNSIYKGYPYYRDSMSDIIKMFLSKKTFYLKHAEISPFIIEEDGRILLRAAFIHDYKQKDILMVAFFEALEGVQKAVDLMITKGIELAAQKELKKLVIGLDAHLNYGVGFLASHFDTVPCFGLSYSKDYYIEYFKNFIGYEFTSFLIDIAKFNLKGEVKILDRLSKSEFVFRFADFKELEREIEIYTELNNKSFTNHLWWAERSFEEDRELLYPFRHFITGENLIIVELKGKAVGFLLWYPDFNQLIPPGKSIGLTTLIKYKLGLKKIDKFKIAEIGILPEYQGTGVVLGLIDKLYQFVKDKYKYCEAGWVENNNIRSKGIGLRWSDISSKEYKKYKAFEVEV